MHCRSIAIRHSSSTTKTLVGIASGFMSFFRLDNNAIGLEWNFDFANQSIRVKLHVQLGAQVVIKFTPYQIGTESSTRRLLNQGTVFFTPFQKQVCGTINGPTYLDSAMQRR